MMDSDTMGTCVDKAVNHGMKNADVVIARMTNSITSQIRFSQSQVDIAKWRVESKLQLFIVIDDKKTGISERPVANVSDVEKTVDNTITFVKRLPESVFYAGVEESKVDYPDLSKNYDTKIGNFIEDAPDIVGSAIDAAMTAGAKRVAGTLEFGKELNFFKSSQGPSGDAKKTRFHFNIRGFQEELDYSGQGLCCGTKPSEHREDMVKAGGKSGMLSKEALGARQGEPGIYDLVLNPTVAADILGFIPYAANPFLILSARSPLGEKLNEKIGPDFVTAYDDPTYPEGLISRPYDFEGTTSKRTEIVEKGVLGRYIHNTSSAKMYDTQSTGNSELVNIMRGVKMLLPKTTNIVFENGQHSIDELIEGSKPTIYMTCNWYTRWQNRVTGDFSTITRDALFLIRNGRREPIKNLRVSDNIMRMFANITALGNDREQIFWWGGERLIPTVVPSVRIADCRITAATQ